MEHKGVYLNMENKKQLIKELRIDKIIDKWAKEHNMDYDCYKLIIQDLKKRLKQ